MVKELLGDITINPNIFAVAQVLYLAWKNDFQHAEFVYYRHKCSQLLQLRVLQPVMQTRASCHPAAPGNGLNYNAPKTSTLSYSFTY